MKDTLDRRDLSEVFRWLAGGMVFCSLAPLLFTSVHPWIALRKSFGDDLAIPSILGITAIVLAGSAIETVAQRTFGSYLQARLFLESYKSGLSVTVRRLANIGRLDFALAWIRTVLCWTYLPGSCISIFVPLLIEMASRIGEDSGYSHSTRITPIHRITLFLAICQPYIEEKWRAVEIECNRSLDRLSLFLTLGTSFLLIGILGTISAFISLRLGYQELASKQAAIATYVIAAGLLARWASGRIFEELLICLAALARKHPVAPIGGSLRSPQSITQTTPQSAPPSYPPTNSQS